MKLLHTLLAIIVILIFVPAFAADTANKSDPFQDVAAQYRAADPKPQLPEEVRRYRVQAEFMVKQNQFQQAADLYAKGIGLAPWWPQGHYDRGIILGELKQYRAAIQEMQRYVALVPNAPDVRQVQDQIYQWESVSGPELAAPEMIRIPGKNYEMGKYLVTQKEWQEVMGSNPSHFGTCADTCPVESVSWNDAQEFIQKLNAGTGNQYRLPTEAEWEYACYGGSQTEYCGGNDIDAVAWHGGNSNGTTHPVGQKQPNGYGLYDMSGSVWEWMENKYDNEHDWRVPRGGAWGDRPQNERAALRGASGPANRSSSLGFRLARTLP